MVKLRRRTMSAHVVSLNQPMVKNEIKTVRKWGNGLGILLPKSMIDNYDLKIGDDLKFIFENDKFVVENNKEVLNIPEFSLEDLMKEYELYDREVYDWDVLTPVGQEIF
jgi:antitoxin component of MazEF toxin-antitoxin module